MNRQILHKTIQVDGVDIFYREAGDPRNRSLLLLHGFPTSSLMFNKLMTALADRYHLVAPDYPGFGFSGFPGPDRFTYTFGNIAACMYRFTELIGLSSFTIYLHDYGSPVGLRMAVEHPGAIEGLIVQNGNAYMEGIGPQWDEVREYWEHPTEEQKQRVYAFISEQGTKDQYTAGVPEALIARVNPEAWIIDWYCMSRPGNADMQYHLNCDYKTNLELFPVFQEYFRCYRPPTLVVWGKHDIYFSLEEATCYQRDLPDAQVHILDGGHMVLETNFDEILALIGEFMARK